VGFWFAVPRESLSLSLDQVAQVDESTTDIAGSATKQDSSAAKEGNVVKGASEKRSGLVGTFAKGAAKKPAAKKNKAAKKKKKPAKKKKKPAKKKKNAAKKKSPKKKSPKKNAAKKKSPKK